MQALEAAYAVANKLQNKENGKVTFVVPTTDQVVKIVTSSGNFIKAFRDFVQFAKKEEVKFPVLKEQPITQDDIDRLVGDLEEIKRMPYA